MSSSQPIQTTTTDSDLVIECLFQFFYTEECGLALFLNRRTGKKFYMDKECWDDLAHCLNSSWQTRAS